MTPSTSLTDTFAGAAPASGAVRAAGDTTSAAVHDAGEFPALEQEWNELAINASASVFQTHDWAYLWWKHFGDSASHDLHIITIRSDGRLVGIGPFFLQRCPLGPFGTYRRLLILGTGVPLRSGRFELFADYSPTDFLDALALPGYEQIVADKLCSHLLSEDPPLDEIDLRNLLPDSFCLRHLLPFLREKGLRCTSVKTETCPRLRVPESLDQFVSSLRPEARRRCRQAVRAFRERPDTAIVSITVGDELQDAFTELVRLHQHRWNSMGYPGLFCEPRFERFQRDLADRFLPHGWLWLKSAVVEGRTAALRLGFNFNGRMYDYLSGFDRTPSVSTLRPGYALLLSLVEDAVRGSCTEIELLRGLEKYKLELTSTAVDIWNVLLTPGKPDGHLRAKIYTVTRRAGMAANKVRGEIAMARVCRRQYLLPIGMAKYFGFAAHRLMEKLHRVRSSVRMPGSQRGGTTSRDGLRHEVHAAALLRDAGSWRPFDLRDLAEQSLVNIRFEQTSQYWKEIYDDTGLNGTIYRRRREATLKLIDTLHLPSAASVLEVGCGAELLTVELALRGKFVEVIDSVDPMVRMTRQLALRAGLGDRVTAMKADAHRLPLGDSVFDLTVALGVIPWLHTPLLALHEMARVTKPGGYLITTSDNRLQLQCLLDPISNPLATPVKMVVRGILKKFRTDGLPGRKARLHMYTIREFDELLRSAGFEKITWRTIGFGPFTVFRHPVIPDRIGRRLDQVLQRLADGDWPLIRRGGLHYLILARKVENPKRNR